MSKVIHAGSYFQVDLIDSAGNITLSDNVYQALITFRIDEIDFNGLDSVDFLNKLLEMEFIQPINISIVLFNQIDNTIHVE